MKDTKEYELFHSSISTQPTFHLHAVWGGGRGWGIILYGHKIIEMEGRHVFMKHLLFHYFDHLHHHRHHHYCLYYIALP